MADLSGQQLGPYELREIIGRGATATVYMAYQPSLNRLVAVKVLEDFNDQGLVARFRREAEAIARLQHRNILPIYDFGNEGGHFYFVVQYVQSGHTLSDFTGTSINPAQAVTIVRRLLDGLGYAHARGIVHRDVKPSNVLLTEPDWPLLADFGVAKLLAEGTSNLTGVGLAVGTPAYMAPEQALNHKIDARTDLYAVGVILYQLLTGVVPFEAGVPHAILLQHINAPVVPPRQLNPAIAPELEAVVMRALEKDPGNRYPDAESMSEALRRLGSPAATSGEHVVPVAAGPRSADAGSAAPPGSASRSPGLAARSGPDGGGHDGATRPGTPAPPTPAPPPPAPPPPASPPPGPAAPPNGPPSRGSRRAQGGMKPRSVAVGTILVVMAGLLGFLLFDRAQISRAGEVVLEPLAAEGEAPFTESVAVTRPQGQVPAPPPAAPAAPRAASPAIQAQSGATPGLYGGSRDAGYCDVEMLIAFLQANPDKAGAWVDALNKDLTLRWSEGTTIRVDQIPAYLRELTPVVLRYDTRVTNHGFSNGQAVARQSVLQAGTAILVDSYGVPRVRCACGNPLAPLQRVSASTPRYVGEKWDTFSPVVIISVQPATVEIGTYVVADPQTGERQELDPGMKPPPCHDVNQDGICDPPCPDANNDGYCDEPCDDLDGDGACDAPCPDENDDQYCDGQEPPPIDSEGITGQSAPDTALPSTAEDGAGTAECPPDGDLDGDGICDVPVVPAPEPTCPDLDGDGICDPAPGPPPDTPTCPDLDGDGACDVSNPVCLPGGDIDGDGDADLNSNGICDSLEGLPAPETATSTSSTA